MRHLNPEEVGLAFYLITTNFTLSVFAGLARWWSGRRLYHSSTKITDVVPIAKCLFLLTWNSRFGVHLFVIFLLFPAALLAFVLTGYKTYTYFIALWLALYLIGQWIRFSIPPAVLLLASSEAVHNRRQKTYGFHILYASIMMGIQPWRAVFLLDLGNFGDTEGRLLLKHNLRTIDDDQWRSVVATLIEHVPIVICDARFDTRYVKEEVKLLQELKDVLSKTYFLSDAIEGHPALNHVETTDEFRIVELLKIKDVLRGTMRKLSGPPSVVVWLFHSIVIVASLAALVICFPTTSVALILATAVVVVFLYVFHVRLSV